MVNRPNREYVYTLPKPILYKEQSFRQIFLSGTPFRGVESAYREFRAAVGIDYLANGNPLITLDHLAANNLKAEAVAYAYRTSLYALHGGLWDPTASTENLDTVRNITRLVRNQTPDESERLRMQEQLDASSMILKIILSQVAEYGKNFDWARQLLNELLVSQSAYKSGTIHLSFDLAVNGNFTFGFTGASNEYEQYLRQRLDDVKSSQLITPQPHNNLLPDPTPHPDSLQARIDHAVAEERYLDAVEPRDRIQDINGRLYNSSANPFVRYVGLELLSRMTKENLGLNLEEDKVRLERIVMGGEIETVVEVQGNTSGSKKVFKMHDADLHARVLHLVHSDPYVTMFGRFNTDLVMVPDKDIPD